MLTRIYNILRAFLGDSKQGGYDSGLEQYQFNCPRCREENDDIPDNKYNLEINLKIGKYHCWKCEAKGNISYLIKKYGDRDLLSDYYAAIKDLKEAKYLDINLFQDTGEDEDDEWVVRLPETFTSIDLSTCKKKKLVEYLNKRHISQDIIDFYGIGYTTWDESSWNMRDRIIIPSYDVNGDLNYWVGRDFVEKAGTKKTKYCNPKTEKEAIICHEDKIQWDADIVLVEGAIDCIYYPNAIPLLGKILSKDSLLFNKLYEKANGKIFICLDGDTEISEIKRIYKLLNVGRLYNRIWFIRLGEDDLPWKDFGEAYEAEEKNGIIKALQSAKQFNEIELLI